MAAAEDATWLKAVAFVNRALDDTGEFEERAFWAACSLRLLANAAVIARPPKPGEAANPATRDNVFRRCQSMTSRFDAVAANGIEASRRRYLDSGEAFGPPIPQSEWWASYWPLVDVLLALQGRQIADLVGLDRQAEIKEILCRSTETAAARVRELMKQATEVSRRRRRGELTADESHAIAARMKTHQAFSVLQECPACGDAGALRGDTTREAAETRVVATEAFGCPACGLFLRGPDAVRQAQLPESFALSTSA